MQHEFQTSGHCQSRRSCDAFYPRRAGVQSRARHLAADHRALHRSRPQCDVCSRGGRGRCLGAAHVPDPDTNQTQEQLRGLRRLERAMATARAEAVWVGWGFVAEHAEFADLCRDMGIVFIGPDGDVMRRLGDKISSKRLAEQARYRSRPGAAGRWRPCRCPAARPAAGISAVHQGHSRRRRSRHSAREFRRRIGGGLRAARAARPSKPLAILPSSWSNLLAAAPATSRCRSLRISTAPPGRPACATARSSGASRRLWKRHRRLRFRPEQDQELREAAVRLSQAAGYHNAGTVEFLYEPARQALPVHGDEHAPPGRASGDGVHDAA